jgi:hypothetical protein
MLMLVLVFPFLEVLVVSIPLCLIVTYRLVTTTILVTGANLFFTHNKFKSVYGVCAPVEVKTHLT